MSFLARLGFLAVICALVLLGQPVPASAKVKVAMCHRCHTMHDSEDGNSVFKSNMETASVSGPAENLLNTTCVGCHTYTGSDGLLIDPTYNTPFVYDTMGPSGGIGLAGGNFYWVAAKSGFVPHVNSKEGDDTYATDVLKAKDSRGHNVWGISNRDVRFPDEAPLIIWHYNGYDPGNCLCHDTLAARAEEPLFNLEGCQGCHCKVDHHGAIQDSNQWYRWLIAPHKMPAGAPIGHVEGIGDDNWEATKSSADHNQYKGTSGVYSREDGESYLNNYKTTTAFCLGCHIVAGQTGEDSSWHRHPTDVKLSKVGYWSQTTKALYDPLVPVGRTDLEKFATSYAGTDKPAKSAVRPDTDVVICLSCHRAHGSPNPFMLRWPYTLLNKQNKDTIKLGTACRVCHRDKP
ncbi:MAG: cytochrome c3 family protein [Pseudomonadota bacterium]